MKFILTICHIGDEKNSWQEEYDEQILDPTEFAEELVAYFNSHRNPGEKKRKLLKVQELKGYV